MRGDTIAKPSYRATIFRVDGSVRLERMDHTGHDIREWFLSVPLEPGERIEYQIRHPGKSRFLTWARRAKEEKS